MNVWEVSILKIISSCGGSASLKDVYFYLPQYIKLTNKHKEIKYSAPNYHHQTRAHIDDLMNSVDLKRIGRGIYSITSKDQLRIGKLKL